MIFSLSSSFYLSGGGINAGIFPQLYYFKHGLIAISAFIALFFVFYFSKIHWNKILLITIPFSSYIFFDGGVFFIQYLIFLFSIIFFASVYSVGFFCFRNAVYLALIFVIVPVVDYYFNNGWFLYNTYYLRERLLLGYFHPKEAGYLFLIITLVFLLGSKIKGISYFLFLGSVSFVFYLIQSRNAILFLVNFLAFDFAIKKFGFKTTFLVFILFYLIFPFMFVFVFFDEVDRLLSFRLSIWLSNLDISFFGDIGALFFESSSLGIESKRFNIDNFYLEFLLKSGLIYFLLLVFFIIYIGFALEKIKINNYYVVSLYFSFLLYCFFDAGMMSTGNFFHIFMWSIFYYSLSKRKRDQENDELLVFYRKYPLIYKL
ncbi:hypothetical protein D5085_10840 [Ectothiorhodospiraceae bacterium BW-2]|nr:hypothetical protein D5085_10840 [Ectothiorhodospiraceae bacterium BW-2]